MLAFLLSASNLVIETWRAIRTCRCPLTVCGCEIHFEGSVATLNSDVVDARLNPTFLLTIESVLQSNKLSQNIAAQGKLGIPIHKFHRNNLKFF